MSQQQLSLARFVFVVAMWSLGYGIQMVMVPYLLAIKLDATGLQIGIAQSLLTMPMLFALVTGALIDRMNRSLVLAQMQLIAGFPILALIVLIYFDALSIPVMFFYSAVMGVIGMVVMPTREAVLGEFARNQIQRWVSASVAFTFGPQIVGFLVAGSVDFVGVVLVLAVQLCVCMAAGVVASSFPATAHRPDTGADVQLMTSVRDAARAAFTSPHVRVLLLFNFAIGLCFVATFMVGIPIFVRDVLNGDGGTLALVNVSFSSMVAVISVVLMFSSPLKRRGNVLLSGLCIGVFVLFMLPMQESVAGAMGLLALWGVGAAISMGLARSALQDVTEEEFRTRHIGLFQSAMFVGATVGSLIVGALNDWLGLSLAMHIFAGLMVCLMVVMWLSRITDLPDQPSSLQEATASVD